MSHPARAAPPPDTDRSEILRRLDYTALEDRDTTSLFARCVRPFLNAIGAFPRERELIEAHPIDRDIADIAMLRRVLDNLAIPTSLEHRDPRFLLEVEIPCIAIPEHGKPVVLIERISEADWLAFDPEVQDFAMLEMPAGEMPVCRADGQSAATPRSRDAHLAGFFYAERHHLATIALYGVGAAAIAIAYPLLIMMMFNFAIAAQNPSAIVPLAMMSLTLMIFENVLRRSKGASLAELQASFLAHCDAAVQRKILSFSLQSLRATPRVQQLQKIHEFTTQYAASLGTALNQAIEFLVLILLLTAILVISPAFAIGPIVALAVMGGALAIARFAARRNAGALNAAQTAWRHLATETVDKARTIRAEQGEEIWSARLTAQSRALFLPKFSEQHRTASLSNLAQFATMVAGALTIWVGAEQVIAGALTTGGLIAALMLIWKVLAPVQGLALNLTKLASFFEIGRKFDRFLELKGEEPAAKARHHLEDFSGEIEFQDLLFRAEKAGRQSLSTLSRQIAPGQLVAVRRGPSTAASQLFGLILRLHDPVSGLVLIDGVNIRQFSRRELRIQIGYAAAEPEILATSLLDNLRFACPDASPPAMIAALDDAGIDLEEPLVSQFLQEPMSPADIAALPLGLRSQIALARVYCKAPKIILLDDPSSYLGARATTELRRKLLDLKGQATVLIATDDPRLLEICDDIIEP